ncbi:MucBP domain-containing protein, partial [Streptococcus suis]|uniref:MucBP domain-containing protein n=1 Tax=Streptococcus suis TaxID=1307 RepID=UPI002FC8FDB2
MFKDQSKKMIKKQEYFSLRKFKRGLASVTVGAALFMVGGGVESLLPSQSAIVYAAETNYYTSSTWAFNSSLNGNQYVNPYLNLAPYSGASTTIDRQNATSVGVTTTIEPINSEVPVGISYLVDGSDQSNYAATADMFVGNPNPSSLPALGIYVQPAPNEGGGTFAGKLNFNGRYEAALLTVKFSEAVTNPIIDLSGLGGDGVINDRASFNSTVLELMTPNVTLEKASTGANLTVANNMIEVTEKNTFNMSVLEAPFYDSGEFRTPNLVPAGTGSVRLNGTFTEVQFKLYHQATPYSAFPTETYGTGSAWFSTTYPEYDGVNGMNKHWADQYNFVANRGIGITNADLFRMSIRLEDAKGSVVVNYVDTEGNVIGTEYKDTTDQVVGTEYNTAVDTGKVASDATTERPAVITKDGKTYKLVAKDTTAKVGTVKADGSLSENAGSFTFGTDTPTGTVAEGTKSITYVYEEVKGSVIVDYVDTDGNKIGTQFVDTANVAPGTTYNTANDTGTKASTETSERPSVITKDGKTYKLVAQGTYTVGTVGTDGNLTTTTQDLGTDAASGEVAEGTKKVTYVYQEVKTGSVVIDYVDTEGNELQKQYVDSPEGTAVGTTYDAEQITGTTEKPAVIEKDGKTYELVPAGTYTVGTVGEDNNLTATTTTLGVAPVTGTVVEGVTKITYVYKEKVETPVVKTGSVVARYVIEGTEDEIADDKSVKPTDTPVDEPYGDTPPATIEKNGKTYELVRTRTNEGDAPENGVVKEGEQTITYEYKEKVETPVVKTGSVVARYVIEGTEDEIADDKSVKPTDTPVDEPYGDTPPATITKDGKTYELVRTRTNEGDAPENGVVKEGEQTITYEYKEKVETPVVKTGSVVARY